ncbi:MAG: DUF4340 domain-containing protein [Clostridia bacterium]|nr:DUF4340 domain-containing protein [Clostridia bacterium]
MTKSKKLILLLGILVVLIGVYAVVSIPRGDGEGDGEMSGLENTEQTETYDFFSLNADKLTAFTYMYDGNEYALTLSEDATSWHWDADPTLPLSNGQITLMINAVLSLSSEYRYTDVDADKLADYGLCEGAQRVIFTLNDGTSEGLIFGKINSFIGMTYCSLVSDPSTVYTVSSGIPPYFTILPTNMVEDDELPSYNKTQFCGFQLQLGENSYLCDYDYVGEQTSADDEKQLTLYKNNDDGTVLDTAKRDALIEVVMGWTLDDAATFDPEYYAQYGVQDDTKNTLSVYYTYTHSFENTETGLTTSTELQGIYKLLLGETTEDGLTYVRLSDATGVYALDLSAILALAE